MCFSSSAKRLVLLNELTPLRESPPPPFIDTKRDGVHAQGIVEVVVFPPNRGGAVVEHCGKYTVGHGVGRGTCPRYRAVPSPSRPALQVPTVPPQRPGWRSSDRSWRTGLRSQPLWGNGGLTPFVLGTVEE